MCSAFQQKSILVCLVALVLAVVCASCRNEPADPATNAKATNTGTTPPAQAEDSSTTGTELLDENPFAGCDMCHIDVVDELAGTQHEAHGVGCIKCHGLSLGHTRDENNEVKPDRVFEKKDMDTFCGVCHKCSRLLATKPVPEPEQGQKVCTDCHGPHKTVSTTNTTKPDS